MKKFLFTAASVAAFTMGFAQGNQCPGCVINMSCTGTEPTLCPTTLPDGVQGQAYDQDLTFFLPLTFTDAGSGTTVTMQQIVVTGISGMPQGLFWTTSSPTNTFVVTSDPNTQRGCAKVCGTPAIPGSFNATVSVLATVQTIIGQQTVPQSFVLPLTILPAAGGNPYFSFNPSTGCGTADVTYEALLNLNSPQVTEWEWDFGNGTTATGQNPSPVNYGTPGAYYPQLTTNVYNHVFNALTANITGGWWCGDIEELNCGNGNADLTFNLTHGGSSYVSSEVANTINPSWSNLGVVLSSLTIGLQFTEVDAISSSDNGGSFAFVVPGPGTYNYSTTAVTSGGGGVNGTFTILKQLFNTYVQSDTVTVYNLPPMATLTSSSGSFNMCSTQPITLSTYGGPYQYEWFLNDTSLIVGAVDSSYTLPDPFNYPYTANYKVKIIDTLTGCATITPNVSVTIVEGIPGLFANGGATYINGVLGSAYSGFASYQWLLNGTPLVPSGQTQSYTPVVNGSYSLVITNSSGCSDTSNVVNVFNVGIEEVGVFNNSISIYPNPGNGLFTINMELEALSDVTVNLIDLTGKTVYSESLGMNNGNITKTVDASHLASGVYTVHIVTEKGTARRKLIIR